jgi:hypothetical protein
MTYEHSQPNAWQQTEFPWMSYAEGFPARTSALPGKAQGSPANGRDYGAITPDLLARYDPASSSWKTSQHCLVGGLETSSETWPRSGMMRSGIAYRLPPLVPLTGEIGYGSSLIPTPTACDYKGSGVPRLNRGPSNNLRDWFKWHFNLQYPPVAVVEYMMGLPTGHTALKPSATPSSRKSQS